MIKGNLEIKKVGSDTKDKFISQLPTKGSLIMSWVMVSSLQKKQQPLNIYTCKKRKYFNSLTSKQEADSLLR